MYFQLEFVFKGSSSHVKCRKDRWNSVGEGAWRKL